MFAAVAHAQDSQFLFDPNGNLLVQTAAATAPPQILGQPQNRTVGPDESASFSVVVLDTRDLTYQWQFKGTDILGATTDAVVLQNVSSGHEGEYRVILTNPSGSVTSNPAFLMLDSDADGLPDSWEQTFFSNLKQNATADFDGDGVSNVTEFLDQTSPTDRASARFRLTVLTDADGVVEVSPTQASYTNGQTISLTATPLGTNLFYGWSGGVQTSNNPVAVTLTSNTTVRAHFQFVPLDIVWTNLAGGDWHSPSNWNPNVVPTALDNAILRITATVTVDSPAECFGLMMGVGSGSPTLAGNDTLTLHGNSTWQFGTMSGGGRTIVETNATLNLTGFCSMNARTLENRGTLLMYSVGGLYVANSSVVTNAAGALFQIVNEAPTLGGGLANGRFDNAGTFRKSSGIGTLTVNKGLNFNNSGLLDLQTGNIVCDGGFTNRGEVTVSARATLRLTAGGAGSGSFTAPPGALVEWTRGTFDFDTGAQCNGSGLYRINGATVRANDQLVVPNLDLISGVLDGDGVLTISNVMNWTGGGMDGTGRTIIPEAARLNLAPPSFVSLNRRTLDNNGTIFWTGTGLFAVTGGAVITNRPGALFHAQNSIGLGGASANGRLDNAGTFRKSPDAGITSFAPGMRLNNSGIVEIESGTLDLGGGGLNTGQITVPPTTALVLSGGAHTADPASSIAGAGQLTVSGGTAELAGFVNVTGSNIFKGGTANLTGQYFCTNNTLMISGGTANFDGTGTVAPALILLNNGSLSGSGTVTATDRMDWMGGSMEGTGRTVIPAGATLNADLPSFAILRARTLENGGTVVYTGAGILAVIGGAVITNRAGASFLVENESTSGFGGASANGRFDNDGLFRKASGTGTTLLQRGLAFNNHGTVDIRSGILAANGGYTSSSNAVLNLALGGTTPATGFGQLKVAGSVTLNGGLSVDFLPGYTPTVNDTFSVLTAGTLNGAFVNFFHPSNAVAMQLSNTLTSVIIRAERLSVPKPTQMMPTLLGEDFALIWTAISNTAYRVEFSPGLENLTNWTPLPGDIIAISNIATKVDALTSSNRLYRILVLP